MRNLPLIFTVVFLVWDMLQAQCAYCCQADTLDSSDTLKSAKKGIVNKVMDYFSESNKPKSNKAFDVSFIGGPHYSSDRGFGLGLVAAGLYSTDRADSLLQPSNVALTFDATTNCYFSVGITNVTIFPHDSKRLETEVKFQSFDTKFWGIGYDMESQDGNESKYNYLKVHANVIFTWRMAKDFYLGPLAGFDFVKGRKMERPELWNGEKNRTITTGAGIVARYDTRDFIPNPYRGVYLALEQRFNPKFAGNTYAYSETDIWARYYHRFWKSGVMAFMFRGQFTYGNTPWGMLPTFGGSDFMRAYYEGRYSDKCSMVACIELRQHIYHRIGMVAWVGAGTVFPEFKALAMRKVLPEIGIGYRWEFKKRVNVRVDYGIGRRSSGIVFSINEAF